MSQEPKRTENMREDGEALWFLRDSQGRIIKILLSEAYSFMFKQNQVPLPKSTVFWTKYQDICNKWSLASLLKLVV